MATLVWKLLDSGSGILILLVGGIIALGAALGIVWKLAESLFAGSIRAGHKLTARALAIPREVGRELQARPAAVPMIADPQSMVTGAQPLITEPVPPIAPVARPARRLRPAALVALAAALVVPSFWLGSRHAPAKVVEREVAVPDHAEAERLMDLLGEAKAQLARAESRAATAEGRLSGLQEAYRAAEGLRQRAEEKVAALTAQVNQLTHPPTDVMDMERLRRQCDALHETAVNQAAAQVLRIRSGSFVDQRIVPPANSNLVLRYHNFGPDGRRLAPGRTYYHKNCATCDRNYQLRRDMDTISARHGGDPIDQWR